MNAPFPDVNQAGTLAIQVTPGVWPPSNFGWRMASLISAFDFKTKHILDVGCGSGIQGIAAAKRGGTVFASDNSPAATACTESNAQRNGVTIEARCGPGLSNWDGNQFDLIICNGPTFEPVTGTDSAALGVSQRLRPIPSILLEVMDQHRRALRPGGQILGMVCGPYSPEIAEAATRSADLTIELLWKLTYIGQIGAFGGSFDPEIAFRSGLAKIRNNGECEIRAALFLAGQA